MTRENIRFEQAVSLIVQACDKSLPDRFRQRGQKWGEAVFKALNPGVRIEAMREANNRLELKEKKRRENFEEFYQVDIGI